jgi:hypothetical protein
MRSSPSCASSTATEARAGSRRVYKFALLEAGVRLRKRVWQEREVVLGEEAWMGLASDANAPDERTETRELIESVKRAPRFSRHINARCSWR